MIAEVLADERQLDGSRHLEIAGAAAKLDASLRVIINRSGKLEEAELNLELDGDFIVIGFEPQANAVMGEVLDMDLRAEAGRASIRQRDDGDFDLALTIDYPEMEAE